MPELLQVRANSSGDPDRDRFDLLVHALAQLPDAVTLHLCDAADEAPLRLLARAYGVEDRIAFTNGPDGEGTLVAHVRAKQTSSTNANGVLLFDPSGDPSEQSDGLTAGELVGALGGNASPSSMHQADDTLASARVAVVTNLPAPYRLPLFKETSDRLGAAGSVFRVFFLGAGENGRPWMNQGAGADFDYRTLKSVPVGRGQRPRMLPLDLELALWQFHPTIVLCGGLSPAVALRASAVARLCRAAFGVWSGEHRRMPTAQAGGIRAAARRLVARHADFGLAYGSLSVEYLRDLNKSLPTVVARNTSALGAAEAPERRHDPPGEPQLLAVGDLGTPRKGIDIAVAALRLMPELDCRLTVVGGGALLPTLKAAARDDPRIEFLGPAPPDAMAAAYRDADVFLFPTREDVFGLALVEAMAAGLATISSLDAGATADLCLNESNCLLVRDHTPRAWAAAIERLVNDHALRTKLGRNARSTIASRWTNRHSADAFIGGLRLGMLVKRAVA